MHIHTYIYDANPFHGCNTLRYVQASVFYKKRHMGLSLWKEWIAVSVVSIYIHLSHFESRLIIRYFYNGEHFPYCQIVTAFQTLALPDETCMDLFASNGFPNFYERFPCFQEIMYSHSYVTGVVGWRENCQLASLIISINATILV